MTPVTTASSLTRSSAPLGPGGGAAGVDRGPRCGALGCGALRHCAHGCGVLGCCAHGCGATRRFGAPPAESDEQSEVGPEQEVGEEVHRPQGGAAEPERGEQRDRRVVKRASIAWRRRAATRRIGVDRGGAGSVTPAGESRGGAGWPGACASRLSRRTRWSLTPVSRPVRTRRSAERRARRPRRSRGSPGRPGPSRAAEHRPVARPQVLHAEKLSKVVENRQFRRRDRCPGAVRDAR